jgi:hypothetical protein
MNDLARKLKRLAKRLREVPALQGVAGSVESITLNLPSDASDADVVDTLKTIYSHLHSIDDAWARWKKLGDPTTEEPPRLTRVEGQFYGLLGTFLTSAAGVDIKDPKFTMPHETRRRLESNGFAMMSLDRASDPYEATVDEVFGKKPAPKVEAKAMAEPWWKRRGPETYEEMEDRMNEVAEEQVDEVFRTQKNRKPPIERPLPVEG